MRKSWRKRAAVLLLWVVLSLGALASCGDKVVFTTGLGKEDVFQIGGETCTVPEVMVYLTNTGNQYESVYGQEVWNISMGGVTFEENVKEAVLAKAAQIKTMYLLAGDRGIVLDQEEEDRVGQAAARYFSSLNERERELLGVDEKIIEKLYREYALANKVYRFIIKDVNPEISDDEARTITVQHILLHTYTEDGAGSRVPFSDVVKQAVYEKACGIRQTAVEEGQDFLELAARYSEGREITISFGKGEMEASFEEAAFSLETGEVSEVIETQEGYYIIKCVSTFDREQTDLNKLTILEERRREAFGQEYDVFVEALVRQLNREVWEGISLLHDPSVQTSSFFDVYAEFFPD